MHDHDLDLIAAYAQGDFDHRAARLVESCGDCRAEYERQRAVRSWLSTAPTIRLHRKERRRLHAALAIAAAAEAPSAALAPRRAIPWWGRTTAVAAVLLVLVAGAGAIRSMLGGGESADFREVAADLQQEEGLATSTTATPATTMTAAAEMSRAQFAEADLGKIALEDLQARLDALLEETKNAAPYGGGLDNAQKKVLACSDTLEGVVLRVLTAEVDGQAAELYVYEDAAGHLQATALDAETCGSLLPLRP